MQSYKNPIIFTKLPVYLNFIIMEFSSIQVNYKAAIKLRSYYVL